MTRPVRSRRIRRLVLEWGMQSSSPRLSRRSVVWLGAAVIAAATLAFAPVIAVTGCFDYETPVQSYCATKWLSLVGLDANVWVWVTMLGVALAMTIGIAKKMR